VSRKSPWAVLLAAVFVFLSAPHLSALPRERSARIKAVEDDLAGILAQADLPQNLIDFRVRFKKTGPHTVRIHCPSGGKVRLDVSASAAEWGAAFYYGLQKLGFLFPHPRMRISPSREEILSQCGEAYEWRPRVRYRGFHLHTVHPNEWVSAFLGEERKIGEEIIRWHARNGQNVLEVRMVRYAFGDLEENFARLIQTAHNLGIHFGVSLSFAMIQQKAVFLIHPWRVLTGIGDHHALRKKLGGFLDAFPVDFVVVNLGTSEFTPTPFERTLGWIETANAVVRQRGRKLFTTVHVSTGQRHPRYGNFNFLPRFSDPSVGVLPHTVMFYGLRDRRAPVYGREDFRDTREFLLEEKERRSVWYYPETSYFIAMDIDVPLFLTDYLLARSDDYDYIAGQGIEGHLNFTTGQEVGYWLFDWTVALLANEENRGRPMIGLELLGEDLGVWRRVLEFQHKHIKKGRLIGMISSTTLLDEVDWFSHEAAHERTLLRELSRRPERLEAELARLEAAIEEMPALEGVRNEELRSLLKVTWNRIFHAYYLRRALRHGLFSAGRARMVNRAGSYRLDSLELMAKVERRFERYPEARLFDEHANPTSYQFGYAWPARELVYWEREESMVRQGIWLPFYKNIYELTRILF